MHSSVSDSSQKPNGELNTESNLISKSARSFGLQLIDKVKSFNHHPDLIRYYLFSFGSQLYCLNFQNWNRGPYAIEEA